MCPNRTSHSKRKFLDIITGEEIEELEKRNILDTGYPSTDEEENLIFELMSECEPPKLETTKTKRRRIKYKEPDNLLRKYPTTDGNKNRIALLEPMCHKLKQISIVDHMSVSVC